MIASLAGKVASIEPQGAVIEVGGVGYHVMMPSSLVANLESGSNVKVFTNLVVREDSMTIYGFDSRVQEELFSTLLGVSGVGPKVALSLLSGLGADGLQRAVASSDIDALCSVQGVGKRGAERIALELRDKLGDGGHSPPSDSKLAEVKDALVGLGYTPGELRGVLAFLAPEEAPVEELVKMALKELARA